MKYNEDNVQQLILSVKKHQEDLNKYKHIDIQRYNQKLNQTIVYVILSVIYNNHLPSTVITDEDAARRFVEDVIGIEVTDLVGFTNEQWLDWINKSIREKQRFPFNIINKIKLLFRQ